MLPLLAVAAAAPTPTPDGQTLLQPCLDSSACDAEWRPLFAETLLESGYTLTHEPVLTSAFGGKGSGLVAEVEVVTPPFGQPNALQELFPTIPALPSLAIGYQVGSYTYETPFPQFAFGLHGLPPIRIGDVRSWTFGGSASAALPVSPSLWLGGEALWTTSAFSAPITGELSSLAAISSFLVASPVCAEPCVDRFDQHAGRLRGGLSVEPIPALFVWGKVGLVGLVQELDLAVDGSSWRWRPVVPEVAGGLGIRAGDRLQLSFASTSARLPAGASTTGGWMTRVLGTMGMRFGRVRYHEDHAP